MALVKCLNCSEVYDHEGNPPLIYPGSISTTLTCPHCLAHGYVIVVVPDHTID